MRLTFHKNPAATSGPLLWSIPRAQELKRTFRRILATGQSPASGLSGVAAGVDRAVTVTKQPLNLSAGMALKPHQMVGLNWLLAVWASRANGILADVREERPR